MLAARASVDIVMCIKAPAATTSCPRLPHDLTTELAILSNAMSNDSSQARPAAFSCAMSEVFFRSSASFGTAPMRAIAS